MQSVRYGISIDTVSFKTMVIQESLSEEGYEMEQAGILVSVANKKHGVKVLLYLMDYRLIPYFSSWISVSE